MPKSQIKITAVARLSPVESTGKEPIYTLKGGRKEILLMDPRSVVIEHNFEFHSVFPPESDNKEVYTEGCKQMIDQVLDGVNGCFLAYGQRKAGKSLTIFGGEDCQSDGVIALSLEHIFEVQKTIEGMTISMTFIDIAQDRIRDLGIAGLSDFDMDSPITLQRFQHDEIRLEEETGAYGIPAATSLPVTDKEQVVMILRKGLEFRRQQETMLNPIALMHTLVIFAIHRPSDSPTPVSYLIFGDLARSEKSRKDSAAVDQINAQHINSVHGSFVSLSRVLENLSKQTEDKDLIIPYRESKVTAVLSKCLNSACNFVLVACIMPVPQLFDDMVNVLQYAGKVKSLALEGVVLNKDIADEARAKDIRMKKLREDINDLKFQLEQFEFLHGKRLKELAAKLGLDFDLENLSLSDPYSREAVSVRNMREAMEKAETLKKRKEEMEAKLDSQREILAEVKLVAINNQEKQARELQEYQVQINLLTSQIQTAQADAVSGLPKGETEKAEELQKLLYHGHLLIEEQSAVVNDLYRVMEGRANWGETNTQERELGRNAIESSNRVNFRTNERDLKIAIREEEERLISTIKKRSESLMRTELNFKSYCRQKEDAVSKYESECVRLLQIAQQQSTLIDGIRSGDFNNGIVPVLIPKNHVPPPPDSIRFKQTFRVAAGKKPLPLLRPSDSIKRSMSLPRPLTSKTPAEPVSVSSLSSINKQTGKQMQLRLHQLADSLYNLHTDIASRHAMMAEMQRRYEDYLQERERFKFLYQEAHGENRKKIVTIETQRQQIRQIFITTEPGSSVVSSRMQSRSGRTRMEASSSTLQLGSSLASKASFDVSKSSLHLSILMRQYKTPKGSTDFSS